MYNLFYDLNDRPFGLKPNPKYFCVTRPHKRTILHMRVGFEQRDGVLVLTGEKGTGKTSLVTHLLDQLDKNDNTIAFIQKTPQKDHEFLPAILTALQIPVTEHQPKALFNTLNKFMLEQAKLNKKVLLVVDEAESLSHKCLELIRLLSTLRLNEHGLLQIVLVGTNKLEEAISAIENQALRQQISISCCMYPMQASDTREYIEHRLKVAGWNGDPLIDEDAFDAIHQLTGGVPYAINRYCDRLLMLGMLRETHHISNKDVSSLTSMTMEKLEKFEAMHQEQEKRTETPEMPIEQASAIHSKSQKASQAQHSAREFDVEQMPFDTPTKKTRRFLNKKTIVTVAAVYLVSSIAVFAFDKISDKNLADLLKTNSTHSESKDHSIAKDHSAAGGHSVVELSDVTHGSSHGPGAVDKYVLDELSAAGANASLSSDASDRQLLDIPLLLQNLHKSDSQKKSYQSDEGLTSDPESYAFDT